MKFKVKSYDADGQYHVCTDENGGDCKLDILVDGSLSDYWGRNPNQLIGRTVDVEDTHAYISIANGVKLIET